MTEATEPVCVGCGDSEAKAHLQVCTMCARHFCHDCAYKAGFGRRFCSSECGRAYYFTGESDDDEDVSSDD